MSGLGIGAKFENKITVGGVQERAKRPLIMGVWVWGKNIILDAQISMLESKMKIHSN